jgi:hypothetical protein
MAPRKRKRASDFPPPKAIDDTDFDAICATFRILKRQKEVVRDFLDKLVDIFADHMKGKRLEPHFSADKDNLEAALGYILKGLDKLRKIGPRGQRAMRSISPYIGPMVAAQWLRDNFPDDDLVPDQVAAPEQHSSLSLRAPLRGDRYDIEQLSLDGRKTFVRARPGKTLVAVLTEIERGLAVAIADRTKVLSRAKGGPVPLQDRDLVLKNLCTIWSQLDRELIAGNKSDFGAFCEAIFVAIGWPTNSVNDDALREAIRDWHNLPQKDDG